jgi:hypothetical protein
MKGAAHFQEKGVADFLLANLGKTIVVDNTKIIKSLGIKFTDVNVTIRDTVNSLIEKGQFVPVKK